MVSAARYAITFQVAFAIVGLCVSGSLLLIGGIDGLGALVLVAAVGLTVLTGWLMGRFDTRRKPVRWSMIAVEGVSGAAFALPTVLDAESNFLRLLAPAVLLPAVAVLLLLLPAAGRWFDR